MKLSYPYKILVLGCTLIGFLITNYSCERNTKDANSTTPKTNKPLIEDTLSLKLTPKFKDRYCFCDSIMTISCDTTFFKNNSMLYWSVNCNSSSLIFEKANGDTIELNSFSGNSRGLEGRIGIRFIEEYSNYALFIQEWVSGCCDPPDVFFWDTNKGKEIFRIPHLQFVAEGTEMNRDYFIFFKEKTFETLILHFHDTQKKYQAKIPKERILNSLHHKGMFSRDFFEKPIINKKEMSIAYEYYDESSEKWNIETIYF